MLSGKEEVFEKIKHQGNLFFEQKLYQRAINYYEHATKIPVSSQLISVCFGNISSCYYQMENFELSIEFALKSLDKDSLNEKSIVKKAYAHERLQELEEAIACYSCLTKDIGDSKDRCQKLLSTLKREEYLKFEILKENEIEFTVEFPLIVVEKYLPSIGNETFKKMSNGNHFQ
jgi:tetratricopeptide (TPR) repeat protein